MKLKKLLSTLAGMGLAGGVLFAGQAQAVFMIDDFNTGTFYNCDDGGGGTGCGPTNDTLPADGTNIVLTKLPATGPTERAGWIRYLTASKTSGDNVESQICVNCQAAHYVSGASTLGGVADFHYENDTGSPINLSDYTRVMFEYAADQDDGQVRFTFGDGVNSASVTSPLLANTGNSNPANLLPHTLALPGGVNYAAITGIWIEIIGVPDLDATLDTVKAVPEPATLALLGLGLAGIGWQRRRRAG